jgi:large subunit ribosomal protein L15
MKLNEIRKPANARKRKRRLGRGDRSGRGKTSGRGHKGARARSGSGGLKPGFEGGQMPLVRRIPKRGFTNIFKKEYQIINLENLNVFKENDTVTPENLKEKGLIKSVNVPVKLLGKGKINKALIIKVNGISESAKKALEGAGGKAQLIK